MMFEIKAGFEVHEQIQAKTVIHPTESQSRKTVLKQIGKLTNLA